MRGSAFVVALLLVSPLAAQNIGPLPPLTAHVDVQIVNVDVTVTDTDGKPVMNLTKNDFEIFEDGNPQKITNFYIVQNQLVRDNGEPAPQLSGPPSLAEVPPEFRRKVLLLIDNNYIEINERNIALNKIEKYVTSTFGAEWAVGVIGRHPDIIQPFTTDPAAIHAAFDRVRKLPTFADMHKIDREILSDRTRKWLDLATDYDYQRTINFSSREQSFRNFVTVQNTTRAVSELARAHSADVGKKYIVLLTGGMELNTSFGAYEKRGTQRDGQLEEMRLDTAKLVDSMVREANAANFTVNVVNARTRGMQAPQHDVENRSSGIDMTNVLRHGGGNDPVDVSDVDSAPLSVAMGTGGMYLPSNDVLASVQRIDNVTSNYYSLGYAPSHQGDRQYHRIRVNVKRKGVRVANRTGYFDLSGEDRLQEMLHAKATFARNVGVLPVTITVGAPSTSSDDVVVPVTAALPMEKVTMLPADNGFVGRVHIYLSVFDNNGRNIGFHHQLQEVNVPDASGAFKYTMKVHLGKGGPFTVAMTLRDDLSNEIGSAAHDLGL